MLLGVLLPLVLLLAPLPGASAALFAAETVDGPSAEIGRLGDLDVARDGSGALVYLRRDGGERHVFAARLSNGAWSAPERIDQGLAGDSAAPVVAVADGGRVAIAFSSGGQLYGVARPAGAPGWPAPSLVYGDSPVSQVAIDMSINGVAYVVFAVAGASASDVRAARLGDATFALIPEPLDVHPARDAGDGAGRPRVAVSADNNAVAIWGETVAPGRTSVFARRLTLLVPSAAPQEVSLAELEGRPGVSADLPELEIEDDGSFAWAVFRQSFDDGGVSRSRGVARRLVGSLFEAPAPIDGLSFASPESAAAPLIDMTGRGVGLASSAASASQTFGAVLSLDVFAAGQRLDAAASAGPPLATPGLAENGAGLIAWQHDPGAGAQRELRAVAFEPQGPTRRPTRVGGEATLSDPALGSVDGAGGLAAAGDRSGNVALAFVQGEGDARRIVVASADRAPSRPVGRSTSNVRRARRPALVWSPARDLWGAPSYVVELDGETIGVTSAARLVPPLPLEDGVHRWTVTAVDRRGQEAVSRTLLLRVDATPPLLELVIAGQRRRKRGLRFDLRASDEYAPGASGVAATRIDYGDGTPPSSLRGTLHRYRAAGTYVVRASARDRLGNVAVERIELRIRNARAAPR